MNWLEENIDEYYMWLKENTSTYMDTHTGWSVIKTPFIGLFNDGIEIYVKQEGNTIHLSDDSMTISNLELMGTSITRSEKRKQLLELITNSYGITLDDNELKTTATRKDFPQKKHNMMCVISEISDMWVTAKHTVKSLFQEDVRTYLNEQEIIYTPHFIAKGSTSLEFTFDFQIAGKEQEIVIKAFNTLTKMNVPNFLFTWNDIQKTRKAITNKDITGLAIINDEEKDIDKQYIEALESKNTPHILWSERHKRENTEKLKAA